VKFYGQINAAMSQITGVPVTNTTVNTLYNTLQQSLPTSNDLSAFTASAQTAISSLADAYCSTAVNTPSIQTVTFPGLVLTQPAASYFGAAPAAGSPATGNRGLVINPLVNAATGGLTPTQAQLVIDELNSLITTLAVTNGATTAQTAQGACSAVLGSAVVSLQ
jgi:hypothetical protein